MKHGKREGEDQHVSSLLDAFLKAHRLETGMQAHRIEQAWESIMGAPIARYTESVRFREGVLYVSLSSPALRQELRYGLSKILKSFQEEFGEEAVTEIVLR